MIAMFYLFVRGTDELNNINIEIEKLVVFSIFRQRLCGNALNSHEKVNW